MNPDSTNLNTRTAIRLILLTMLISVPSEAPMARAWQDAPSQPASQGTASRLYLPLIQIIPDPVPWGSNQFGYVGLDNLNTRTPTFQWIEIAGSGTEVAADAWPESSASDLGRQIGPIPLGMYFPIFDAQYNAVWIHDAGNLHFGNGYYTSETPTVRGLTYPTGQPNYIPGQSHIYYLRLTQPDRFVVEFRGLRVCCADGTADLEIILYQSGDIRIQYLQLGTHDPTRILVGVSSIFATNALIYPAPPAASRIVTFTYPQQPNHAYVPDAQRWYTYTLPRQPYSARNTIIPGPGEGITQTLFISSPGWLLRSETGGREWTVVTPSSNTTATGGANWNPQHYALSPDYAETGVVMAVGRGPLRSANRGNSWAELGGPTGVLNDIAFSPAFATDRTVVALGETGIWISTDAGLTWENHAPALAGMGLVTIRFSPDYAQDRTLWATTYAGPLYRSNDGGVSWSTVALPSGTGQASAQAVIVRDLQPAPNYGAAHLLFLLGQRGSYGSVSLYRSEDAGTSWRLLANVSYDSRLIRVDPTDATNQTLYLGKDIEDGQSGPVQRSQDGGMTWQTFSQGLATTAGGVTALSIQPESGRLMVLTYNFPSIWLFTRTPDMPEWQRVTAPSPDLSVVQPGIGQDQAGNPVMWAGGYRSDNGGRTWAAHGEAMPGGVLRAVAPSPNYVDDGTAIAWSGSALLHTTDWGATWSSQADCFGGALQGQQLIALSPVFRNDRTAFAVCDGSVMRSTDAGVSWQALYSGDATNVALSPDFAHDHTVFALLGYYNTTLIGSTDAGTTWGSFPGPWSAALLRVSPAYVADHTLYAGANNYSGGGLWRSTDGGMSWNRLPTPVEYYVTGLVLPTDTANSDDLFIANQFAWMGIAWLSADRGETWQGVSSGLGDYGLSQVYVYHDATDRVYTFNERGMWWRTMRWH